MLVYREADKSDKVAWVTFHQSLNQVTGACVVYIKRKVQARMLEPGSEESPAFIKQHLTLWNSKQF